MSAASEPTGGRERELTQARIREARDLKAKGQSHGQIAARLNISERRVAQYLQSPHEATEADANGEPRPDGDAVPVRKRIRRATFLDRAKAALDSDRRLNTLEAGQKWSWLDCATSIHVIGSAEGLMFKRDGFGDLASFNKMHGCSDRDMQLFIDRQVLEPVGDAGLSIPESLGIRCWNTPKAKRAPRPTAESAPVPRPNAPVKTPPAGQRSFTGGGFVRPVQDAAVGNFDGNISEKISEKGNFDGNFDGNISDAGEENCAEISENGEIISLARGKGTTTTTKVSENLPSSGGGGTLTRATDGNFRNGENFLPEGNLGNFPSAENFLPGGNLGSPEAPDLAVAELAARVKDAAGYSAELTENDRAAVAGWLKSEVPEAFVLKVVREDRAKPNPKPVYGLKFFTTEIQAAWALEKAAPGMPPAVVLSPADQAIRDRLNPHVEAWMADPNGYPSPPTLDACRDPATEAAAQQWLTVCDTWISRGRPRDLKPPWFSDRAKKRAVYDAAMLEIEEELTAPDVPAEDSG